MYSQLLGAIPRNSRNIKRTRALESSIRFSYLFKGNFQQLRSFSNTLALASRKDDIHFQLDYYMSSQFAGIAMAQELGIYDQKDLNVTILPTCPPGEEPAAVLKNQEKAEEENKTVITIGSIEQNILYPCVKGKNQKVTALAAMFGRSPLCIASVSPEIRTIGAHEDTVELIQALVPQSIQVIPVEREEKMSALLTGKVDGIQVYDVMEVLKLLESKDETLKNCLEVLPLQHLKNTTNQDEENHLTEPTELGYSQVIFTPSHLLTSYKNQEIIKRFLEATFDGWKHAIRDPTVAAKFVLQMQPRDIDHWQNDLEFTRKTVERCCDYVKATSMGGKLGVIDPTIWESANRFFHSIYNHGNEKSHRPGDDTTLDLDTSIWNINKRLMLGSPLARTLLSDIGIKSRQVRERLGRNPSLSVITVGDEAVGVTHKDARRRLQLYSPQDASWFSKTMTGRALGVDVEEINLPASTTTKELISLLLKHQSKDGIQLMWPLPEHINTCEVYSVIPSEQDVDGAHYISRMEMSGGHNAYRNGKVDLYENAPVTPHAVMLLLETNNIPLKGKRAVVIGRSRIVGQPLAYMLTSAGAIVTMLHKDIEGKDIEEICLDADILITCAGSPGLVQPTWVKPGATVVNVGTTFTNDELKPDTPADIDVLSHANRIASCPGGVGPLSVALLFQNTVKSAEIRAKQIGMSPTLSEEVIDALGSTPIGLGATPETKSISENQLQDWLALHPAWEKTKSSLESATALRRKFHFETYSLAMSFINKLMKSAAVINHHPNIGIIHQCIEGVDVEIEYFTYDTSTLSHFDIHGADLADNYYKTFSQN